MRTLENNQVQKEHSEDIIQEGLIEKVIFIKGLHESREQRMNNLKESFRQKSANAKTQSRMCPVIEYIRLVLEGKSGYKCEKHQHTDIFKAMR